MSVWYIKRGHKDLRSGIKRLLRFALSIKIILCTTCQHETENSFQLFIGKKN